MGTAHYKSGADKLGIASAVICTIHCLVVPLLFIGKYWLGDTLHINTMSAGEQSILPSWWEAIDYVFLLISFVAVYHAAAHAATRPIRVSLWIWWGVLAAAIVFGHRLHALAYLASAGLISTHIVNIRRHSRQSAAAVAEAIVAE